MKPAEVVLRFLESVGRRSEAEFYLAHFLSSPKERFAAISVDANVARHAAEAVVLHLRFLHALTLTPVVVLGLLEAVDSEKYARRLHRRLEAEGVPADVLSASTEDLATRVTDSARAGRIALVFLDRTHGTTVDDRVTKLGGLLSSLQSRKLIFLHRPGGLRQKGVLLPLVNLTTDSAALVQSSELSRKERVLVEQSRRLVHDLAPHGLAVAITSPLNLFRELFTVKGAGTLLRRGARIRRYESLDGIDRGRLRTLLTSSFNRPPLENFFERPFSDVYLEEDYRGAALLQRTPLGTYLNKFAVDRVAQGEGLGRDLWMAFATDHPTVFWRARPDNPIGEWYGKLCDGLVRVGEWIVYWRGLEPERIPEAIRWALAQPVDLPPLAGAGLAPRRAGTQR